MNATRILLLRHGETTWNVDTRVQGHTDIALNPTGHWQAQRLGQALAEEDLAAIYSSDLQRARHTAEAVARAVRLSVQPEPALRERCFGMLEGKTWADIEAQHPLEAQAWRQRQPDWRPHGGESLIDLRDRVMAAFERIARRHIGQHIALVAHGGVLDILYRAATGLPLQAPRSWLIPNAAINRLLWTPESLTLIGWGDTAHLQRDDAPASAPRASAAPADRQVDPHTPHPAPHPSARDETTT